MLKVRKILYPTDFSGCAEQALSHALFLAQQFDAELHMLHALVLHADDPHSPAYHFPEPVEILQRVSEIAKSDMAELVKAHQGETLKIREAQEKGVSAAPVILDYVDQHEIDVIVMGTHGRRGVRRLLLGSVAEEVVRLATCPVLTLGMAEERRGVEAIDDILVPVDFSDHSKEAIRYGKELASQYGAKVHLLHVVHEEFYPDFYGPVGVQSVIEALSELEASSKTALEEVGAATDGPEVPIEAHVVRGRPATEIVKLAEERNFDMIVVATHGLTGMEHLLLGSTAEQVVRTAPCPVFTVKSFGRSLVEP